MRRSTARATTATLAWARNNFIPRTITISIEDEVVRIVAFEGRKVVAWGAAAKEWLGTETEDPQLAAQVRGLLNALPYRRGRVVTSLPLSSTLSRTLHLRKIERSYLERVIVSELSETIPFSEGEVDIAWQRRDTDGEQHVFASVSAKDVIDRHSSLMRAASQMSDWSRCRGQRVPQTPRTLKRRRIPTR